MLAPPRLGRELVRSVIGSGLTDRQSALLPLVDPSGTARLAVGREAPFGRARRLERQASLFSVVTGKIALGFLPKARDDLAEKDADLCRNGSTPHASLAPNVLALRKAATDAGAFALNRRDQEELWGFVAPLLTSTIDLEALWRFANNDPVERGILEQALQAEADNRGVPLVREAQQRDPETTGV